jgi:hypothetical protein
LKRTSLYAVIPTNVGIQQAGKKRREAPSNSKRRRRGLNVAQGKRFPRGIASPWGLKGMHKKIAENIREKFNGKIPLRIFPFFYFALSGVHFFLCHFFSGQRKVFDLPCPGLRLGRASGAFILTSLRAVFNRASREGGGRVARRAPSPTLPAKTFISL